jgi:hypothetical protein
MRSWRTVFVFRDHLWRDISHLALVEVAASLCTGVLLYLLSSSIGDWIDKKPRRFASVGRAPFRAEVSTGLAHYSSAVSELPYAKVG